MGIPRTGSHATRIALNEIPAIKGKLSAGKLSAHEAEAPEALHSRIIATPDFKAALNPPKTPYTKIFVGDKTVAIAWKWHSPEGVASPRLLITLSPGGSGPCALR